mmetsp:Transcript_13495/g.37939  ORF Transcript_13495/g.37939 Transcript_13495/m.37939 type:complete len:382 (+) Transcript_13495:155-1300(+)|eukprot:CAMPEP_0172357540 /NCGR_PEP_ID=MMETSP1060-20121228/1905_1 /TAXON_ID=37318 /ORGANISM="Pseudo-nitzschia pungens, Strain cf. cingulata" /LENGTH=381 /DNA_ID=CAMNT_0013078267 /DNA_START=152 /DNA_END=1297 /DNA_ORIENTATION=+
MAFENTCHHRMSHHRLARRCCIFIISSMLMAMTMVHHTAAYSTVLTRSSASSPNNEHSVLNRAKFLSASAATFAGGATAGFLSASWNPGMAHAAIAKKSSAQPFDGSNNPRYIERDLAMTYGEDKDGNPRSRGILVRRWTGDSTPYQFPVTPLEFTKVWPEEWPFRETDFFRSDSNDDGWFYKVPRLVYHIDEPAAASLTQYYRKNIRVKSDILDICSSWVSHYPLEFPKTMGKICGTGMNKFELEFNDQLTGGYETKDLNDDPTLPYQDNSFDVVTCVVSIDYLIEPIKILQEIHRVLRPGGKVIISQSNRCFPSKAIAMWLGMTDRQHLELINGYFQYAGGFEPRKAFDITATVPENGWDLFGGNGPMFVIEATKARNA